jgi:DNA-binding response OmpR family regulator
MSSPVAPTRYAIGVYELDTQQKIVLLDGTRVPLTPKAVDLLTILVRDPRFAPLRTTQQFMMWTHNALPMSSLSR